MRRNVFIGACLHSILVCAAAASGEPLYNIVPLGLDDFEHTRNDGYKNGGAFQLNEAGQVFGVSQRFNGGSTDLGSSAWLYDGATTIAIGLVGSEHTRNDGYKSSGVLRLYESGQVLGVSYRYNGGSTFLGRTLWLYDGATTTDVDLPGNEHTRNDGYKYSFDDQWNEARQVRGHSSRYNGGSTDLGQTVWLFDGATTINVGLTGSEHTRNDGYKYSEAFDLNEAGQVLGYSYRYNGGSDDLGYSAWLYDGATAINIGLTGNEYTRNDGYKFSGPSQLNEAGQVCGSSNRYNGGSTYLGNRAWLYDGATTIELVGLTDSEHTDSSGNRSSAAERLNNAGQVVGSSVRYNGGSTYLGFTLWLYDGANTIAIGLTGSEHTTASGYKHGGYVQQLNEAGQVLGRTTRYVGGNIPLGESVWLYDGASTINIGLTGAEHTRNNVYKYSQAFDLNEAGQVIGESRRFNGSAGWGASAWLYDGATTIDIGLTGSEHTNSNGGKTSRALQLNEAGQVVGYSWRYNGGNAQFENSENAQSAWLYNGATTIDIGLNGAEHTRNDGYKYSSFAYRMNEAGQVLGYSRRYNGGGTNLGQDAWLYDPLLDQTFALNLSTRSDGYAYSSANYLGEDGLVLGSYTLFDALDNNLGDRAFYFTIAGGLHDLGSLVEGGLAANGWDSLANAIRTNGLGQILGLGQLTTQSGGWMPYLLTRVTPLPGDVNFDGVVDIFDINLLSAHWGETGSAGDANGDGMVDIFDINMISSNWTPTGGAGSAAAVPEPSTLILILIGLLGVGAVYRTSAARGTVPLARHTRRLWRPHSIAPRKLGQFPVNGYVANDALVL